MESWRNQTFNPAGGGGAPGGVGGAPGGGGGAPGGVGGAPAGGGWACMSVGSQLSGVILPPILTIDVVLGLVGNVVALWIFLFRLKSWNPNILFLFSLVIADFLALASLPLRIDALLSGSWRYGDGMCRFNLFLIFSNRTASIIFMTVVAVYRYFKVVHFQHRFSRLSLRQAVWVSAVVWLLVVAPRVPLLAYNHLKDSGPKTKCLLITSYWETSRGILVLVTMHRVLTVLEFLVPMAVLFFCSARIWLFLKRRQMGNVGNVEKVRRAMRVCVVIVVVFMVCFLPTTVTTIGVWVIRSLRPGDCASFYTFTMLNIVSHGLNFLNSALDPLVYVFSSSTFRRSLCSSMPRCLRCKQDQDQNQDQNLDLGATSGTQSITETSIQTSTQLELKSTTQTTT